ncbi:hypothetical protein QE152_g3651 [Popillia japonica]|uniref:HTH CENPB-type domain-containing protein n=1 Tax=Popillia japonica TaxID=7064 RepID=A0AAW1N3F6_POPJA
MQELGFRLTVNQIRNLAYKLTASSGKPHPFSKDKEMAGWYWWGKFKERYGLAIRQPENLFMNRANMATREVLDDFYSKLKTLAEKLGIDKSADRFWNLDETGLTYVMKSNRVVTLVVVYKKGKINRKADELSRTEIHYQGEEASATPQITSEELEETVNALGATEITSEDVGRVLQTEESDNRDLQIQPSQEELDDILTMLKIDKKTPKPEPSKQPKPTVNSPTPKPGPSKPAEIRKANYSDSP